MSMEYKYTEISPDTIKDAIKEAYAQAALVQRLAAKPTLTPDEVSAVYGLSVPYLAKMRAENRGPEYVMLGTRKIVYTQKAIEKWMRVQTVTPRNV